MNAAKDVNGASSLICASSVNGTDIIRVKADPTTHKLQTFDGTTGTDYGPKNAKKDQNSVSTLIAVSSVDGVTPVPVYCDASGNLLIDTT